MDEAQYARDLEARYARDLDERFEADLARAYADDPEAFASPAELLTRAVGALRDARRMLDVPMFSHAEYVRLKKRLDAALATYGRQADA